MSKYGPYTLLRPLSSPLYKNYVKIKTGMEISHFQNNSLFDIERWHGLCIDGTKHFNFCNP